MISPDSLDIILNSENRPTEKEFYHPGWMEEIQRGRQRAQRGTESRQRGLFSANLCDLCGVKYL